MDSRSIQHNPFELGWIESNLKSHLIENELLTAEVTRARGTLRSVGDRQDLPEGRRYPHRNRPIGQSPGLLRVPVVPPQFPQQPGNGRVFR